MSSQMLNSKIAEPYAAALLDLAVSTHTLDLVSADINDLFEIFSNNKDLQSYLANPLYSHESKKAVLNKILVPLYFNQNTVKFLMVLVDRNRINLFPSIAEKYLQKVYDFVDIQIVNVKSAFPIEESQEQELISALRKIINAHEIKLVKTIDKSLLGGFQVKFGSYIIDASLKAQLRQLANQLQVSFV
uniref:ATP synthase subunit delta, chloroplastic n=1 Tax=Rhizochromulina marina TaxID=1034831 RepID=A0A514CQ22_9STRA|nr:F-type H+-transporting ATPase subunit delta [Rhizochromulina marina]QDH81867.1 F-type H+-transporting ATPase subunit delta [Rhizochromulina marina]